MSALAGAGRAQIGRLARMLPAFCCLAAVFILALFIVDQQNRYAAAVQESERAATKYADLLAEHTARTFEAIDRALQEAVLIHNDFGSGRYRRPGSLASALHHVQQGAPAIIDLAIVDASGHVVAGSREERLRTAEDVASTPYFRALRDDDPTTLLLTRGDRKEGWATIASRRLETADGSFAGIAMAEIDRGYFAGIYRSVRPGAHGTVVLSLRDGWLVVREPFVESAFERSFATETLFAERLPKAEAGHHQTVSPVDGSGRIMGYRAVPGFPLVLLVSYAEEDVFAAWLGEVERTAPVVALVVLALLSGAALLWRQARQLKRAGSEKSRVHELTQSISANLPGVLFRRVRHPDGSYSYPFFGGSLVGDFDVLAPSPQLLVRLAPEEAERLRSSVEESARNMTPWEFKGRWTLPDGTVRWFRSTALPRAAADGSVVWDGIALDVTAQHLAEQALRDSEARYRLLAENANDVIVRIGLDGTRRYISPSCRGLYGFAPEELVGKDVFEFIHPDDRDKARAALRELSAGAAVQFIEMRMRRKDGSYVWVESQARNVDNPETGEREILSVARDISGRRGAQHALRESEARLQSILDSAPVAISLKDRQHRYVVINRQYKKWFGVTAEQQLGRTLTDVGTEPQFAGIMESMEDRVLETGEVQSIEVKEPDVGTAPVWVSTTKFPIRDRDGSIVGVGTVNVDITDQRAAKLVLEQAKAAAEEANRAKSDFLATMSHEIRTPLNAIIGFTELLLDSKLTPEQQRQAQLLQGAGKVLLSLLNDVLDVAKIEAGKLELERVPMSPGAVVDAAVSILRGQIEAKGLKLRLDLAPDLPEFIAGDPTRLQQILLNLLNNAVRFTDAGNISIRVAPDAVERQQLRFEVADTGIGVPADRQHLLFQNFSQIDRSTTRRYGGTGLGLVICKRLAEAMGGSIGVVSEAGKGSLFWFTIAATTVAREEPAVLSLPAAVPHQAARVLVAEDVRVNQILVEAILRNAGHEVALVPDGAAAVAAVAERDFDLVLMDMEMPVMNGVSATKAIRALDAPARDIPIIALTANAMAEEASRCRAAGMNAHLAKPIDRAQLLRTVEEWASRGRLGDAAKAEASATRYSAA
jgi:PAS domain S-box-containing protein